jgi:two-component system, OmpR family, response regulator
MSTMGDQATALRRADGGPIRVLVVDDEPRCRTCCPMALRYEGWDVNVAADRGSALWAARRPDAVVLDVMLPDFDWLDVLRRIRAEAPKVPVLFLTATDVVEHRVAGPTAGYVLTPAAGG